MPRRSGDFENNDDIYKEIENHDKGLILTMQWPYQLSTLYLPLFRAWLYGLTLMTLTWPWILDDRVGRSQSSMEEEANLLRKKINEMIARP